MTKETIVGIDPSLGGTAVCLIDRQGQAQTFRYESQAPSPKTAVNRAKRYRWLVTRISQHLRWDKVRRILIEGYSFGSKGQAVLDLAEFGGILREFLTRKIEQAGLPELLEVPPAVLKKFMTGKGNADKLQVAVAIVKRYNLELPSHDEYDAYSLARIGACLEGWCQPETDFQQEAIKGLLRHGANEDQTKG